MFRKTAPPTPLRARAATVNDDLTLAPSSKLSMGEAMWLYIMIPCQGKKEGDFELTSFIQSVGLSMSAVSLF